jgi:hypothetical protein
MNTSNDMLWQVAELKKNNVTTQETLVHLLMHITAKMFEK